MLGDLLLAIVAGIAGGLISPFLLQRLVHQYIWKSEKLIEYRVEAFRHAARALAQYEADALNPALQAQRQSDGTVARVTSMRDETADLLSEARAMVRAHFSRATYDVYSFAERRHVSIANNPNTEFDAAREEAFDAMAREIAIKPDDRPHWIRAIVKKFRPGGID